MSTPVLLHDDLHSRTWRKIKEHIESTLCKLRIELEADASPERTAHLRGRIKALNLILALETPAPVLVEEMEPD